MAYEDFPWIDVPDPQNPPPGAKETSAANLKAAAKKAHDQAVATAKSYTDAEIADLPTGPGSGPADVTIPWQVVAPGDIVATAGLEPYPITQAGTFAGWTPSCRSDRRPHGRDAIADVIRVRGGTAVSMFALAGQRPTIPKDIASNLPPIGSRAVVTQNGDVQPGDYLLFPTIQGGYVQEAAGYEGSAATNAATASGSTFTVARPVGLVYNEDQPRQITVALHRDNKTTTVATPEGAELVKTVDANGAHRIYVFTFTDDGNETGWTFAQSGSVAGQSTLVAWAQPPASSSPLDDVASWVSSSTAAASYTIPALETHGEDRALFALIFSSAGVDHRSLPSTGSWLNSNSVTNGRIGIVRRYPGSTTGVMGPWVGGKYKDAADADTNVIGVVVAFAFTPRASEPGADFMLTGEFHPS